MSVTFGPGITLGSGITVAPTLPGFTINSSDLFSGNAIYQNTTALGPDGVDGFQNTAAENWLGEGYVCHQLNSALITAISDYVNAQGINPLNSQGYLYNVTWGAGSSIASGIVKLGFYSGGGNPNNSYVDIQAIDTSDPNYLTPNNNSGTSLVGTFLFPATFTIYSPLTDKNGWC